jgi:hypothetical protein
MVMMITMMLMMLMVDEAFARTLTSPQKKIASWAKEVGLENGYRIQKKESTSWSYSIADLYVV